MIKEDIQQLLPENTEIISSGKTISFEVSSSDLVRLATDFYEEKHYSFKLMTATDERKEKGYFKIWYVFSDPESHTLIVPSVILKDTTEFPSITLFIYKAWKYEQKIHTFFGLTPVGHPDLRPILLHENWPTEVVFPLRKDFAWNTKQKIARGKYTFQKVKGEGIYEIPVGPIHAGIIEPGHFRFSVAGESIVSLEARLGFTHKGSEKLFETLSLADKVKLSEKISGDSSFSHSLAFCQAIEELGSIIVPKRASMLRVIYAELERLANHSGDIGAMMMDTGFNFGGAHGARLREMILRINEKLTGKRFLRSINTIGGVTKDITEEMKETLLRDLTAWKKDFSEVIDVAENSTSLLNRMKDTGILTPEIAKQYGTLGVAGRASGIPGDARINYSYAGYGDMTLPQISVEEDGDVYARFHIRIKEVFASLEILEKSLTIIPLGEILSPHNTITLRQDAFTVSIVEGWRGEIVYFVATDRTGNVSRVTPCDPSFVNWSLLKDSAFDNVIPDFPLINKSFNLSYSGNDL